MPKKKRKESASEQSARFKAEVERLVAAGELNPIEAEKTLNKLVLSSATDPHQEYKSETPVEPKK